MEENRRGTMKKTGMKRRTFGALTAGAVVAAGATTTKARAADGKVLRFVQNGNMTILDPIWTTAYVTRTHGYFIYDTLFSMDANNEVKPQMVDKYEVSADKTLWTFTLRDGLAWHDGSPVTAEDCIPSIRSAWKTRLAGWPSPKRAGAGIASLIVATRSPVRSNGSTPRRRTIARAIWRA
jgi:ABC-type transport system substrate-binding protein